MATTPPATQVQITSEPVKFPIVQLISAVALGIVIAVSTVGGGLYYLLRSGKLPIQGRAVSPQSAVAPNTHSVSLQPLLVNLADSSGTAYLRLALTLQIADASPTKSDSKGESSGIGQGPEAAVRDTVLMVLGRQTSDALLTVDGKEHLRKELQSAIAEHNPDVRVTGLFFTDFLVQR